VLKKIGKRSLRMSLLDVIERHVRIKLRLKMKIKA
jgi:hypothetical protein